MARIDAAFRLNVNGWYEFGKAYSGGSACYRGPVSRGYRVVRFYVAERSCDLRPLRSIVCGVPELSVQVPPRPAAVAPRRGGFFGFGCRAYAPAGRRGQTAAARAKYGNAIAACDDAKYIEYNVSQIAHLFGLNPTGLSNQLRAHCPELLERRELERRRLGLADNQQRGVRPWCREQYAAAVKLLRTTELTLSEAAERCGVSFTGLRQHVCFYHKDLQQTRSELRERAKTQRRKGHITGSGRRHEPTPGSRERYRDAVRLYRNTAMTIKEIAEKLGLNQFSFTNYLQTWHREDVFARRGAEYREGASLSQTKQYKKPTAAKYAPAIERLRAENRPTSEIAAEFGLHPEVFRQYLKEHEPELYARQGMMRAPNGRSVSRRSMEKYAEAVGLYETTAEPLKSIARRLGLNYNSLGGFVRRNFPELIEKNKECSVPCDGSDAERQ